MHERKTQSVSPSASSTSTNTSTNSNNSWSNSSLSTTPMSDVNINYNVNHHKLTSKLRDENEHRHSVDRINNIEMIDDGDDNAIEMNLINENSNEDQIEIDEPADHKDPDDETDEPNDDDDDDDDDDDGLDFDPVAISRTALEDLLKDDSNDSNETPSTLTTLTFQSNRFPPSSISNPNSSNYHSNFIHNNLNQTQVQHQQHVQQHFGGVNALKQLLPNVNIHYQSNGQVNNTGGQLHMAAGGQLPGGQIFNTQTFHQQNQFPQTRTTHNNQYPKPTMPRYAAEFGWTPAGIKIPQNIHSQQQQQQSVQSSADPLIIHQEILRRQQQVLCQSMNQQQQQQQQQQQLPFGHQHFENAFFIQQNRTIHHGSQLQHQPPPGF